MSYSSKNPSRYSRQEHAKVAVYTERMSAGYAPQPLQEILILGTALVLVLSAFSFLN